MRIIEQLVYKIQGDNSEFDKSIDKSETKVNKFGSVADKMLAGVTVAAIGMVVKKMGDMVMASATALDRVDKLSQKIGISRVAFQEWDYILGQSGASVEGLQMGVKTLSNAADEARKGTALYAEAFDRLGVSVTDANGNMKDQETLFAEVFSSLADMENQTERTAIATKLLGRSATELAPTLNTSKEGIEQLRSEAHSLGLVYSDELVDAGVVLGDNIDRLKKSFEAFKTNALSPIIGLAVTFTDKMLGQNTATSNLNDITESIVATNLEYKDVVSKLSTDIDTMTESEKLNLVARKASLEFETIKQLEEMSKEYENVSARLVSNSKDIEHNNRKILDADISIAQYARQLGMTSDELKEASQNYTEWNNKSQASVQIFQKVNGLLGDKIYYEGLNSKAIQDSTKAEGERQAFINKTALLIQTEQISMDSLLGINAELTQAIEKQVEAYRLKEQGIAEAEKRLSEMDKTTIEGIQYQIDYYKSIQDGYKDTLNVAMITRILNGLQEEKNRLLVEAANATNDANEKEKARKEILDNMSESMVSAEQYALALGDSYDLNAQKASILETTIKALIDSGLTAEDEEVKKLITTLLALSVQTVKTSATVQTAIDAFEARDASQAFQPWATEAEDTSGKIVSSWLDWIGVASSSLGTLSDAVDSFSGDTISKMGQTTQAIGQATGDTTTQVVGAVISAVGEVISFFDDMAERGEIWANSMKNLSYSVMQTELTNRKTTLDTDYKNTQDHLNDLENLAISAAISRLSAEEQQELKAQGFIEETKMERLARELEEAKKAGDTEKASVLQNAISIQSIRDDYLDKRQNAEREYQKKVAQYEYDKSVLDKNIAIANAEIARNKAIADLGWFNRGKKNEVNSLYDELIGAITSTPLPPIPSYDVGSIRIPETTTATVHKDEMILTAPQAEQARREGITIAPTKNGGNLVNLVIYLDGKEIARNTIDNLNSGSVGTIKARVVK